MITTEKIFFGGGITMEKKKEKVALNDELLEKVSGGKSSCYGAVEVDDNVFCVQCGGDKMLLDLGYGLYECITCGIAFDLNGNIYTPQ